MADKREQSEFLAEIGFSVIDKYPEFNALKDISIGYLLSGDKKRSKGKFILGECEKIADKWKWAVPYDFTITFFEPNCIDLNDLQMEILMRHELKHIGVALSEDGVPVFSIVPHDVEDFKDIIKEHGLEWANVPEG